MGNNPLNLTDPTGTTAARLGAGLGAAFGMPAVGGLLGGAIGSAIGGLTSRGGSSGTINYSSPAVSSTINSYISSLLSSPSSVASSFAAALTLQTNAWNVGVAPLSNAFHLEPSPSPREQALFLGSLALPVMREIAAQQKYIADHEQVIVEMLQRVPLGPMSMVAVPPALAERVARLEINRRQLVSAMSKLQTINEMYSERGLDELYIDEMYDRGGGHMAYDRGYGLAVAAWAAYHKSYDYRPAGVSSTGDEVLVLSAALVRPAMALAKIGRSAVSPELTLSQRLTILNPTFTPNPAKVMQNLVTQQSEKLASDLTLAKMVLSEAEYLAATRSPQVAWMNFGKAVERMVAQRIGEDPAGLGTLFRHAGGPGKYDVIGIGPAQGQLFEITTKTAVQAHTERWYGWMVEYATYARPEDFTLFPPLQ